MREDVGRVTQKYPGSAENGAVYNHAGVFYVYSLYTIGERDRAYKVLRQMLPGPDEADYVQRGQLPVYIPNYYRGAWHLHPRTAGRSSHLFNTGTISWVYRCFVEELFGLRGDAEPDHQSAAAVRLAASQGRTHLPGRNIHRRHPTRRRQGGDGKAGRQDLRAGSHHWHQKGRQVPA